MGKASTLLSRGKKERCVEASLWTVSFLAFGTIILVPEAVRFT